MLQSEEKVVGEVVAVEHWSIHAKYWQEVAAWCAASL